jgi:hypothetical protein
MQTNKGTRLKQPHSAADISELEDGLAELSADLRQIRTKMAEKGLPAVEIMAGTFRFYLTEMRQIAKDWNSALEKQLIAQVATKLRERKQKETEEKRRKR